MSPPDISSEIPALERLPCGIAGLDQVLGGGFFKSSMYIVRGEPGTGKTILGNQICFNHVKAGGRALYITLLAESHHRMLSHLRDLSFFDAGAISHTMHYISAFPVLEKEGLAGLLTLVRREVVSRGASVLILDGLVQAGQLATSSTELKKFIHALQMQASVTDCTMFLLTSARPLEVSPEQTMVDGMIVLCDELTGWIAKRHLIVTKFRGGAYLRGRHAFSIGSDGLFVFPRMEVAYERPGGFDSGSRQRLTTGIAGLDSMLGGGLPEASCTLLLGPTGVGKTVTGLHFLGQSDEGTPGLFYGFFETPANLLRKAGSLVPSIGHLVEQDIVGMHWQSGTERLLDEIGHELLELVERRKVRRLVVDGLNAFDRLAADPDRMSAFFTVLSNELRARGVAVLFTLEVNDLIGPIVEAPLNNLTQLADNMVLLRFAERDGRVHRLLSVLKVRDGDFDPTVREFAIQSGEIRVLEPFESAESLLRSPTGGSRSSAGSPARRPYGR
jgi:circadian clock protein KaiC